MASSRMLRRVALVRTHVSEERSASFIRVTGIGTTLAVTSNRSVRQTSNYDHVLFRQVVTTTARSFRRPTGTLYNPNGVRQRSTTSTTTSTETPASSTASDQHSRKPGTRLVRRRKYGSSITNRTRDSDATASEVQASDASNAAPTGKGNAALCLGRCCSSAEQIRENHAANSS
jgi:hypothetical protein